MAKDQKQNRTKILKKLDEMKKYKLVNMPDDAGKSYRVSKVYGSSELLGEEKKKPNFLHDFVEASEMDASVEKGYKGKAKLFSKSNNLKLGNDTTAVLLSKREILDISDEFLEKIGNCDIVISTAYDENFTIGELKQIYAIRKKLGESGRRIYFADYDSKYSVESVLHANAKLSSWASEINRATFNGRPLTQLEKFMAAYKTVTNFAQYSLENTGSNPALSRAISSILNYSKNDQLICCVGYASLLQALCARIGIACEIQREQILDEDESRNYAGNHQTCRVYINDETYGVKGVFHSDPCFDSLTDRSPYGTLLYALNSFDYFEDIEPDSRKFNRAETAILSGFEPDDSDCLMVNADAHLDELLKKAKLMPNVQEVSKYIKKYPIESAQKFISKVLADRKANPKFTNQADYVSNPILKFLAKQEEDALEYLLENRLELGNIIRDFELKIANGKAMINVYKENLGEEIPVSTLKKAMMVAQASACESKKEAKQICASMFEKSSINALFTDIFPFIQAEAHDQEAPEVECPELVARLKKAITEYELRNEDTSNETMQVSVPVILDWIYQDMGVFENLSLASNTDYLNYNPWLKELLSKDNKTFDSMLNYKIRMLRLMNKTIGDSEERKATTKSIADEPEPGDNE